jgi:imidazolonepropionase-like amidohydrolase
MLVAAIGLSPSGAEAQEATQTLALTNANVIDGISDQPIRQATVMVRDGRIVSIATATPDIPTGTTVIDLKGMWLLPGLIDAHVHFADLARWADSPQSPNG